MALSGCIYFTNWDDVHRSWIGSAVSEYSKLNGAADHIDQLDDGNKEYMWHFERIDPKCRQYFEVNAKGIIVSTHHTGNCVPVG